MLLDDDFDFKKRSNSQYMTHDFLKSKTMIRERKNSHDDTNKENNILSDEEVRRGSMMFRNGKNVLT